MSNKNCYVTGQISAMPYTLEKRMVIPLTQECYAHFIIRSSKNVMYQQIKKDLDSTRTKLQAYENKHLFCSTSSPDFVDNLTADVYIDLLVEMAIVADKAHAFMTQLTEASVAIFRAMRDEFKKTGRVTS